MEPLASDHPEYRAYVAALWPLTGGGRLLEVVAYKSLEHNGSKFRLIIVCQMVAYTGGKKKKEISNFLP